jgi:predicted nucleotidyltransferase component of viral defense system
MKEQALALIHGLSNPGQALNRLREYLQTLILASLHDCEAFRALAFVGGTALRILYGLPRFSVDLDFSLEKQENYAGKEWMGKIKRSLTLAGFLPEVTWNESKTVNVGWVRLRGILHEANLSVHPDQKLAIKLEIDTRPPHGARCERRVVSLYRTFVLQFYDMSSLFAGKLHAVISRRFNKGRDWYDLLWYRSRRPPVKPNLELLQNALDQTRGTGILDARQWPELVRSRITDLDLKAVIAEVRPFLERSEDSAILTKENLVALLQDY